jgi:hypothetical protein
MPKSPTWKVREPLFVWQLVQPLYGTVGPTSSKAKTGTVFEFNDIHKPSHHKKKFIFNKVEILGTATLLLESFCSACGNSKHSGIKLMNTGCWDFCYNELAQYCVH